MGLRARIAGALGVAAALGAAGSMLDIGETLGRGSRPEDPARSSGEADGRAAGGDPARALARDRAARDREAIDLLEQNLAEVRKARGEVLRTSKHPATLRALDEHAARLEARLRGHGKGARQSP
jgi:hypothetical protein